MRKKIFGTALAASTVLLVQGCSVQLISQYDEGTDKGVTDYVQKMEAHYETLDRSSLPSCTYSNFKTFYSTTSAELDALAVRVRTIPKNANTIEQVDNLIKQLVYLEENHKDFGSKKCPSGETFKSSLQQIRKASCAILVLELAKKRGEIQASTDECSNIPLEEIKATAKAAVTATSPK